MQPGRVLIYSCVHMMHLLAVLNVAPPCMYSSNADVFNPVLGAS